MNAMGLLTSIVGTPEARFWRWFRKYSTEFASWYDLNYLRLATRSDDLLAPLHKVENRLDRAARGLLFELGPRISGRRRIVISADGDESLFPAVERVVDAAPDLSGWRVVAFRQRETLPKMVELGELSLRPCDVWFSAEPSSGKLALTLYIEHLRLLDGEDMERAGGMLVMKALGEYDAVKKLSGTKYRTLPEFPEESGLKLLTDLQRTVSSLLP